MVFENSDVFYIPTEKFQILLACVHLYKATERRDRITEIMRLGKRKRKKWNKEGNREIWQYRDGWLEKHIATKEILGKKQKVDKRKGNLGEREGKVKRWI